MKRSDEVAENTPLDICKDHFNMEEDLESYVRFRYNGGRTKTKEGVMPHILKCLPDESTTFTSPEKYLKRPRQPTLDDILIANKLLKESFEGDDIFDFSTVPCHVFDSKMEKEAAESLLLLSCSANG